MSSLMQFNGKIRYNFRTKLSEVGLMFIVYTDHPDPEHKYYGLDTDVFICSKCNQVHPRIGVAYRRPRGMWGCWVVFQYNGSKHVPDLSCPISVKKYPIGTIMMTRSECETYWHS